jgi:ABC-type branched-subunit amino acid transport system ATPase component
MTEAPLDALEHASEALLDDSRRALGISGDARVPTLRAGIRACGAGWYTLVAICALAVVDGLQRVTYAASASPVSQSTGLPQAQFNTAILIGAATLTFSAFATVWALGRVPDRGRVAVAGGLISGLGLVGAAFATGAWGFNLALGAVGVGLGVAQAVQRPMLMDAYPPNVRMRVFSVYAGTLAVAGIAAVGLIWLLTDVLSLTWRVVFLATGSIAILGALVAIRLRNPQPGRWDATPVCNLVGEADREDADEEARELTEGDFAVSFAQQVRLALRPKTMKSMLLVFFVLGAALGPIQTYVGDYLESRWHMESLEQWAMYAAFSAFALPALFVFARRGESCFQTSPARLLRVMAVLLGVASVAIGVVTFFRFLPLAILLLGTAFACYFVLLPAATVVMLSIVPPHLRAHASASAGVAFAALGGVGGRFLVSSIDSRFGLRWALTAFAVTGLGIASSVARASRSTRANATSLTEEVVLPDVDEDLDRVAQDLIAAEELRQMVSGGQHFPLLGCRKIDFSYGQVQVLFGVEFTVDDGEMVALLGTNGAGKSTLLRVLSGIGIPSNGTVHFRGGNITHVDAEQRVRLGITQVPGGRAVFAGMSVVDNLRASGHGQGMSRAKVEQAIDESFDAFPPLAARRNQSASVLSGGEQQMLGIARAIMSRPRLLLIDELSLGLAPIVVGQLLETVRQINASGTAVVLVEQSVNIALSLVDHAYFMEKGQIRFDGVASELLGRPDLLRSVFLEGAGPGESLR